ncbi:MAG TPA: hypothetical protein VF989_15240 [Polyangiaceae bacterium]
MKQQGSPPETPFAVLPEEQEEELSEALSCAWAPPDVDAALHRRLLEIALEDPLAPPSAAEREEAERLRRTLDDADDTDDGATVLTALRSAYTPSELDRARERALRGSGGGGALPRRARRAAWLLGAVGTALAAAATWVAWIDVPRSFEATPSHPSLRTYVSRSTTPLFDDRFAVGAASARVDRIATARARELRDNRFANWGLR